MYPSLVPRYARPRVFLHCAPCVWGASREGVWLLLAVHPACPATSRTRYFGLATALGRIAAPWRMRYRCGLARAAYSYPETVVNCLPRLLVGPCTRTNPPQTTSSSTSAQPHTSRSAGTPPRSTTPRPSSRSPRSPPRILAKDGNFGGARAVLAHYSPSSHSSSSSHTSSGGEKMNEKDELLSKVTDAEVAAAQLWTACGKSATRALTVATHSVSVRSLRVECALGAGDIEGAVEHMRCVFAFCLVVLPRPVPVLIVTSLSPVTLSPVLPSFLVPAFLLVSTCSVPLPLPLLPFPV
ncbi:hypothetical protein B0H17DRAFT_1204884 [Mycena rosella]|uniref:Uncharacterized protein n=1 Tax=Mycena rosella TaxID=1033263 RepID=A0AAD7DBX0_MYCRO|nr:hypothetical protein B0H17DRAFT_1204884 [Mycena rosella]